MYIVIFNYDQKNHSIMIDLKGFIVFYNSFNEAEEKAKTFIDDYYKNFKILKVVYK